jgi:hypothetical protein
MISHATVASARGRVCGRKGISQGCVSDLPQAVGETQPRVEALRNPGYRILNVDRSDLSAEGLAKEEGAEENTRPRSTSSWLDM